MAHESFEDPAAAEVLNREFVCIKVDREERPDVDRVYMTFVQATTGSGGWPMSVWLTPSLEPFYGGTYFPPTASLGPAVVPGRVPGDGAGLARGAGHASRLGGRGDRAAPRRRGDVRPRARRPDAALLDGGAPAVRADLRRPPGRVRRCAEVPAPVRAAVPGSASTPAAARSGRATMVLQTLRAMAMGGMRDHVGGGFHRYSVDGGWRVPHFEKMLYDQAQLVLALLEAGR